MITHHPVTPRFTCTHPFFLPTEESHMEPLTTTDIRAFGHGADQDHPLHNPNTPQTNAYRIAKLTETLASALSTHTNDELCALAVILMENHRVPITTVRTFLRNLPKGVFAMRVRNRRTILYSAITTRGAVVPDILDLSPVRVLATGDSNGMTPFHFACRHGTANDITAIGTITPHSSRDRMSRAGRSPLVEAILLLRGSSIIDAILPFVSHTNLWQTKDRFGLCVLHVAICSDDDFTVNHILDSTMDIVANVFGMVSGYANPGFVNFAVKWGNYIPGPGDPDPTMPGGGGGTHQYTGDPRAAWGPGPVKSW